MKIGVTGISGKMGQTIASMVLANEIVELASGLVRQGNNFDGVDLGEFLGQEKSGKKITSNIDEFFKYGKSKGVDFRPFFVPLSSLPFFEKNKSNVNSYKLFQNGINLPSFHDMTFDDCKDVSEIIVSFINR